MKWDCLIEARLPTYRTQYHVSGVFVHAEDKQSAIAAAHAALREMGLQTRDVVSVYQIPDSSIQVGG